MGRRILLPGITHGNEKKTKFFKSLRFRILVILLILGIVPSVIVTQLMISNYEKQAIEVKVSEVSTQCAIHV